MKPFVIAISPPLLLGGIVAHNEQCVCAASVTERNSVASIRKVSSSTSFGRHGTPLNQLPPATRRFVELRSACSLVQIVDGWIE